MTKKQRQERASRAALAMWAKLTPRQRSMKARRAIRARWAKVA